MLLVTQTETLGARLGDTQAIKLICETGFDGIDYSMFWMDGADCVLNGPDYKHYALGLKKLAQSYGVDFCQAHAPFPSYDHKTENPEISRRMFQRLPRAIEIAGLLGAGTLVIHPASLKDPGHQLEVNMELYRRLAPYGRDFGVTIALENMWVRGEKGQPLLPGACGTPQEFCDYVDTLGSGFTACLDLGHCGLVGLAAPDMIRQIGGKRLTALHVHDNNGHSDSHLFPYSGVMDWPAITAALGEIGYTGNLTFEADKGLAPYPDALLPEALKLLHSIGRQLIAQI